MADTIGDLFDKLSIVNVRQWHLEDARREASAHAMLPEQQKKAAQLADQIGKSNKERISLIDQINASMRVLIDKAAAKDSTFQLTADELLGTGKNKFYKTEDHG